MLFRAAAAAARRSVHSGALGAARRAPPEARRLRNLDVPVLRPDAALPPAERLEFMARQHWDRKRAALADAGHCERCWLRTCLCAELDACAEDPDTGSRAPEPAHSLMVMMHFKEYARVTNTGKLLLHAFGDRGHLVPFGLGQDERAAAERLECESERSLVLFPCKDATPAAEYVQKRASAGPLQIVVLDGTWQQARTMNKRIPSSIERVCVDPGGPSVFRLRRQTTPARVCTLEAVSLLLAELNSADDIAVADHLLRLLGVLNNEVEAMGAHGTAREGMR